MIQRKGVISFLVITFGITYLIEGLLILSGFRVSAIPPAVGQFVVMGAMWVPALATFITIRFITHEPVSSTWLRFGPSWKPYLATMGIIPLVFLLTYALTWLVGLGQPDWHLDTFYRLIATTGVDMSTAPDPTMLLILLLVTSLTINTIASSIIAFGEEWGWRGYLLPRLMPLGKAKAYALLGVIWGMWHAPIVLVGLNYSGRPLLGVVMMILYCSAISLYLNELTLRYKSSLLAGWIHGVFNSQGYGIWRSLLFASTNPFLGGITGLVGIVFMAVGGILTIRWANRKEAGQPAVQTGAPVSAS